MKVDDNMAISETELNQKFDAIEDLVTSLKVHQPALKDDEINSKLKKVGKSHTFFLLSSCSFLLPLLLCFYNFLSCSLSIIYILLVFM